MRLTRRKAEVLLAYLAMRPGQLHARDALTALLWPHVGDAEARLSLRQTIFALRRALADVDPPVLLVDGESVALNTGAAEIDVVTFERLVGEGTRTALEAAAALYRGDLLAGTSVSEPPFEEWLVAERERLRELAMEALAKLLAHQTGTGQTERAIQIGLRLLALDPLQEVAHRALMRLYVRQGRRGAALQQYQACVDVLARELGADPDGETRALYQEILRRRSLEIVSKSESLPLGIDRRADVALVGRDGELGQLWDAFGEATLGHGRVFLVAGEAGIGKTSLVVGLAARADQQGARVLLGRSYESEQILPFGPWVDAFRTGQVVSEATVLEALEPRWRAELARLCPEVETSALPPPSGDQRRLFESVVQLIAHLAAVRPLVLILEDLHWADDMSVRLLSFVGRRIHDRTVLVVATARDEELDDAASLRRVLDELRRAGEFAELLLAPLSPQDTAALVRSLARGGGAPTRLSDLAAQVWRASEGNPFMVVETLRSVGEGTPLGSSALPLPRRVQDLVASRLARLSDRARELAAVAAVIGREFDFALLANASAVAERDAAERMEELVRRRVLHGVGEEFEFTHDRIREVAYREILAPRRRLLHAHVATAVRELHTDDLTPHAASLGWHYLRAEIWPEAARHLHRAGRQAAARSAYREAVESFELALTALRHVPQGTEANALGIEVRFDLRGALVPLGQPSSAVDRARGNRGPRRRTR